MVKTTLGLGSLGLVRELFEKGWLNFYGVVSNKLFEIDLLVKDRVALPFGDGDVVWNIILLKLLWHLAF